MRDLALCYLLLLCSQLLLNKVMIKKQIFKGHACSLLGIVVKCCGAIKKGTNIHHWVATNSFKLSMKTWHAVAHFLQFSVPVAHLNIFYKRLCTNFRTKKKTTFGLPVGQCWHLITTTSWTEEPSQNLFCMEWPAWYQQFSCAAVFICITIGELTWYGLLFSLVF